MDVLWCTDSALEMGNKVVLDDIGMTSKDKDKFSALLI
jgi:hypothetical protein